MLNKFNNSEKFLRAVLAYSRVSLCPVGQKYGGNSENQLSGYPKEEEKQCEEKKERKTGILTKAKYACKHHHIDRRQAAWTTLMLNPDPDQTNT